jgi:hypothetical protein
MVIDAERLAAAAAIVEALGAGDAAIARLREQWPQWRVLLCADDDIPARLPPAFDASGFRLYLIGSGEHCLTLTRDAANAIGFVVATVSES